MFKGMKFTLVIASLALMTMVSCKNECAKECEGANCDSVKVESVDTLSVEVLDSVKTSSVTTDSVK